MGEMDELCDRAGFSCHKLTLTISAYVCPVRLVSVLFRLLRRQSYTLPVSWEPFLFCVGV